MSIAKTLIQKEIDRYRRGVQTAKKANIKFEEAKKEKNGTKKDKEILDGWIKTNEKAILASAKPLKELETDLKKL